MVSAAYEYHEVADSKYTWRTREQFSPASKMVYIGRLKRQIGIQRSWVSPILSVFNVLYALVCYFILFLGLTYLPRAECQFLFLPVFEFRRKGIPKGIKLSR